MGKEDTNKTNITVERSKLTQNAVRIFKGSAIAIILSIILLLIFAAVLTYTDVSEATMLPVVTTIVGISILLGSCISARKIRKNGILNGGLVGLIYVMALYLTSSICLVGFSLTVNSFILLAVAIITGMLGGIIGVNFYLEK